MLDPTPSTGKLSISGLPPSNPATSAGKQTIGQRMSGLVTNPPSPTEVLKLAPKGIAMGLRGITDLIDKATQAATIVAGGAAGLGVGIGIGAVIVVYAFLPKSHIDSVSHEKISYKKEVLNGLEAAKDTVKFCGKLGTGVSLIPALLGYVAKWGVGTIAYGFDRLGGTKESSKASFDRFTSQEFLLEKLFPA